MSGLLFPAWKEWRDPVDPFDMELLALLEDGLPIVSEPYNEIGRHLGLNGEEVLERIEKLMEDGVIRRFRARINQRRVGITANALVAWKRGDSQNGDVGSILAASSCVTHCYERLPVPGRWEYAFYTVHHGCSREEVLSEIKALSDRVGVDDYRVLFSTEEFKRVPNVRVREHGGLKP